MARTPKPWYWTERKAWYATVGGKRHLLDADEAKARKAFYRLMAADGQLDERQKGKVLVADAVEAMLAGVQHNRLNTRRLYLYSLEPFAVKFAKRRLDSIRYEEIIAYLSASKGTAKPGHRPFGDSARCIMLRHIRATFRWARESGLIERNPCHGKPMPWKILPRERVMTEVEYRAIMDSQASPQFKEVFEILWRSGARPSEVACMHARHPDATRPIVRLQPTEHKTGTKTGQQREIHMPEDIMARLRAYAVERPKTHLLVRRNGKPWSQHLISGTFRTWKVKLGLAPDCVVYLARHAFGTRALDAGHSIAMVAKMLGHNDTNTIMRHYFHPDQVAMIDAVNKLGDSRPSET